MFRFSRTNWFGRVGYRQFKGIATNVTRIARKSVSELEVEVLTYERFEAAGNHPKATVISDAAMNGGGQKSCALEDFTEAVWKRAVEVQLTIRDPASYTSFMICVACCPSGWQHAIDFYGQGIPEELFTRIYDTYAVSSLFVHVSRGNRLEQSLIGATI